MSTYTVTATVVLTVQVEADDEDAAEVEAQASFDRMVDLAEGKEDIDPGDLSVIAVECYEED